MPQLEARLRERQNPASDEGLSACDFADFALLHRVIRSPRVAFRRNVKLVSKVSLEKKLRGIRAATLVTLKWHERAGVPLMAGNNRMILPAPAPPR